MIYDIYCRFEKKSCVIISYKENEGKYLFRISCTSFIEQQSDLFLVYLYINTLLWAKGTSNSN